MHLYICTYTHIDKAHTKYTKYLCVEDAYAIEQPVGEQEQQREYSEKCSVNSQARQGGPGRTQEQGPAGQHEDQQLKGQREEEALTGCAT